MALIPKMSKYRAKEVLKPLLNTFAKHLIGIFSGPSRMNIRKPQNRSAEIKPTAKSTIVLREEFENKALLYDPDTGNTYDINPVGAFVWKKLNGRCSIDQIAAEVNDIFDTGTSFVIEDLHAFLHDLKYRGFIE